ncbi:hypothetical protein DRN93_05310 [archaeon]|nr:MAG: hypothetical protein DRN93_05310 [archaeon]
MFLVNVIGPAGCGKSTLTKSFSEWMMVEGYSVGKVNLDPGCRETPYIPNVDVRER